MQAGRKGQVLDRCEQPRQRRIARQAAEDPDRDGQPSEDRQWAENTSEEDRLATLGGD
jgi:hypothetical protein